MNDPIRSQFEAKAAWHRSQRQLSPRDKVRIVLELQQRELAANRVRTSLGLPVTTITPWRTKP